MIVSQRLLTFGWDYRNWPDMPGAVAEIETVAETPGSEPVVTSFGDLAFEFIGIAQFTWQGVGG